jgi:hypothetical protein
MDTWPVLCDCGAARGFTANALASGKWRACRAACEANPLGGEARRSREAHPPMPTLRHRSRGDDLGAPMVGDRFGALVVLGQQRMARAKRWRARCDCGRVEACTAQAFWLRAGCTACARPPPDHYLRRETLLEGRAWPR